MVGECSFHSTFYHGGSAREDTENVRRDQWSGLIIMENVGLLSFWDNWYIGASWIFVFVVGLQRYEPSPFQFLPHSCIFISEVKSLCSFSHECLYFFSQLHHHFHLINMVITGFLVLASITRRVSCGHHVS